MGGRVGATVGREHRSLRDATVEELRELIIDGELPQGSRLIERDLADRLEVSRIPLREAIQQLESESLARRVPRRGSVVATLTRADVIDLFDVRESLESLAAGLAARRRDAAALTDLGSCLQRSAAATERGSLSEISARNIEFHDAIVRAAGNALLTSMMTPLRSRTRWLFRLTTAQGIDPVALCGEHADIHDAIAAGSRAKAERLTREHVAKTRTPTLELLDGALAADPLWNDVSTQ